VSQRIFPARNHSNENVFCLQVYFHVNQTHVSYRKVLHEDSLKTEAQGNTEMAYYNDSYIYAKLLYLQADWSERNPFLVIPLCRSCSSFPLCTNPIHFHSLSSKKRQHCIYVKKYTPAFWSSSSFPCSDYKVCHATVLYTNSLYRSWHSTRGTSWEKLV